MTPGILHLAKVKQARDAVVHWLKPYYAATAGGEAAMLRYLDDPDVPCYAPGWLKADKNRFHQERAPGAAKKYVFNPQSWVYAFRDSLTAVSVAGEWPWPGNSVPDQGWGSKRGVTLITPRHVVTCAHGPPGLGTLSYPARFRFVGTDGETYERTLIGRANCYQGYTVEIGGVLHAGDASIWTLDSDLPPVVKPVRTISSHPKFRWTYGDWTRLFISQSIEIDSPMPGVYGEQSSYYPWAPPEFSFPHFPRRHRSMCCFTNHTDPKVGYAVWGGDSGMPEFIGYGTELLWYGFCGGGGFGPNGYPLNVQGVNVTWEAVSAALIDKADDNAMTTGLGDIAGRTGYRCQFADEIPDLLP